LIRAFRFVVDRKPEARLVIVGTGPLREELASVVHSLDLAERVSFAGEISHERLPELYRSAALFVQASLHEAQGMAVLEAAACGLPIVGTPVGALADLAPDAAVIAPGDPIRMAQAMLSVLGDASWRRTLGQFARARVEHEYSLAAAADRFEELYRRPPPPRLMVMAD
jgi:glycosyltransferase involved in cell wall biosynthesis